MAENCARPGCGHPFATQRTGPADWESGHAQSLARECSQCPCPGYRTPKQQSTWREVERVLGQFKRDLPQAPILAIGLLRELQKLYP